MPVTQIQENRPRATAEHQCSATRKASDFIQANHRALPDLFAVLTALRRPETSVEDEAALPQQARQGAQVTLVRATSEITLMIAESQKVAVSSIDHPLRARERDCKTTSVEMPIPPPSESTTGRPGHGERFAISLTPRMEDSGPFSNRPWRHWTAMAPQSLPPKNDFLLPCGGPMRRRR